MGHGVYGWISDLDTNVSLLRPIATINLWETGEGAIGVYGRVLALGTALDKSAMTLHQGSNQVYGQCSK